MKGCMQSINKIFLLLVLLVTVVPPCFPTEELHDIRTLRPEIPNSYDSYTDLKTSLGYMIKGSYLQFATAQNLMLWTLSSVGIGYLLYRGDKDKKLSQKIVDKNKNESINKVISDVALFFNFPIIPIGFYYLGRGNRDDKMVRFSQEYFAALSMTLIETNLISVIPIHKRPSPDDLTFWDKYFRYESSFPSGHVIGFYTLGFKAFQFYGPLWAAPALALGVAASIERVHSKKHYTSDVIASAVFSFFASEGVRMASNYSGNNQIYKWMIAHEFDVGYRSLPEGRGIQLSMSY